MKILITGAGGFVGSHLATELADHEVVAIDKNEADLAVPYETDRVIDEARPDYVVHLGARYGRILCRMEPHRAVADNAAGTTELAAVCAERGIPVLYASSSEVYGDHGLETITEASELRTPTTIYGLSKRWGEEALSLYLPPEMLCITRFNMIYGAQQRGGHGLCSLATFIRSAVEGDSYTVHRETSRSWLYVSDAVRAVRLLIEGGHHGTFNVSNPTPPLPMTKIAEMVGGEYRVEDAPRGQIRHKNYDCSKVLGTINWVPEVSLAEGIDKTYEWARQAYAPTLTP